MKLPTILAAAVLGLAALPGAAKAASCSANMVNESAVGGWCTQNWVDHLWDAYDFDSGDWDQGFGYPNACDRARPLGRTFNAIYVLNYADGPAGKSRSDFSGSILHWGGNFSMREMDATAILDYFAPLQVWLDAQNKGQTCGW